MKLYEVTIKAFKTFYVEAESEDDALKHDTVSDEDDANWTGTYEWQHDETRVKELDPTRAAYIRQKRPEQIATA